MFFIQLRPGAAGSQVVLRPPTRVRVAVGEEVGWWVGVGVEGDER